MSNTTRVYRRLQQIFTKNEAQHCLISLGRVPENILIDLKNNAIFFNCIKHLQKKHQESYFENSAKFEVNFEEPAEKLLILRRFQDIYLINITVEEDDFFIQVSRLNKKKYPQRREEFSVEFTNGDLVFVKYEAISYTMKTTKKDLKSVFEDIHRLEITLNINLFVICVSCDNILPLIDGKCAYCGGSMSWYCLKCYQLKFGRYMLQTDGYEDAKIKEQKYNLFFSDYKKCLICRSQIDRLIDHHRSKHKDLIHLTGSQFKISKTVGKYCLLERQDLLLVCHYCLDENKLIFVVRAPWSSDEIVSYCCWITLTTIGAFPETKTYKMQLLLLEFDDWRLAIENYTFKDWNCEFEVTIDITEVL